MKALGSVIALVLLSLAAGARAQADAAPPSTAPSPVADAGPAASEPTSDTFRTSVDLAPLRTLALQHMQTVKTLDSYARQTLEQITGRGTYQGQDPVFTVLDMAFRPESYQALNLIKIKNLPLRTDFKQLKFLSEEEQQRIVRTGLVSLDLMRRPEVGELLGNEQSMDVRKAQAVNQVALAEQALDDLTKTFSGGKDLFLPAAVVPPATTAEADVKWHRLIDVAGSDPSWVMFSQKIGAGAPPVLPNYTAAQVTPIFTNAVMLYTAWRGQDPKVASDAARSLADALARVNPAVYPSMLKRNAEVIYNRLAKMTLPGATFYFFAFICFLMAASSGVARLRLWGLRLVVLGLLVHTAGIGIRWWLVGSIPIKNEFESVMFSAWFGVLVGLVLELRFGRSLFGAAASFIGWLSLIAIFTVPYVFNTSIGQNIEQVNGVLMSYWLYIHVTMVTASYALIGMGFLLSAWWLVKYYLDYGTVSRVPTRRLEGQASGFDVVLPSGGGGVATLGFASTLAQMVFFPVRSEPRPAQKVAVATDAVDADVRFLAALDACNLVVLQLAFWVLGAGIVCGAVWADMSWGRPWGWDPKETFALITWIVYLIVVHVRVATDDKAWWTAVLSLIGFFVMLFNWIGVNYFLTGLHSYAG